MAHHWYCNILGMESSCIIVVQVVLYYTHRLLRGGGARCVVREAQTLVRVLSRSFILGGKQLEPSFPV